MTEVLTRQEAIGKDLLPTGRKVGVVSVPGTAMLKIAFLDGPGTLPDKYAGKFTSRIRAGVEMKKYLAEFWDVSDAATRKGK